MQKKSEKSKERGGTYYILHNCGDCIFVCLLSESEKRNRCPSEMAGNREKSCRQVSGLAYRDFAGNRWENGNLQEREWKTYL